MNCVYAQAQQQGKDFILYLLSANCRYYPLNCGNNKILIYVDICIFLHNKTT